MVGKGKGTRKHEALTGGSGDPVLDEVKYFGVYITSSLSWSLQCEAVKTKANKIWVYSGGTFHPATGRLTREPMLTWSVQLRSTQPLLGHHIPPKIFLPLSLRRATRFVLNDYSRNSSVSAMLADLNWPQSLEERRIINDLTMFYKINSSFVNIFFPAEISLGFRGTRRSHDYKFMPLSASVIAYKYWSSFRTIAVWNGLPFSAVHASSVNFVKASIVLN